MADSGMSGSGPGVGIAETHEPRLPTNSGRSSAAAGTSGDTETGPSPVEQLPVSYAPAHEPAPRESRLG